MSDIRIKNVLMQNFLSVRSASIDLENRGLVGVLGPNGIGKSTGLVEALTCGIFGISERYGRSRDKWINRFIGNDLHLKVALTVGDVPVIIDTYRKHHQYKDEVFLTVNGKDLRGNNNEQTYEKIVRILDMDYIGFTSGIVFGQAISQYFSALNDSSQKEIMERLLGITWISSAYELAKIDREECLGSLTKVENTIIRGNESIEELQSNLKEYQEKSEEFDKNKNQKIEDLKRQFRDEKGTSKLESELKAYEIEKNYSDKCIEEINYKISEIEKRLAEFRALQNIYARDIANIENKIKNIDSIKDGALCVFCGQKITTKTIDAYKLHLGEDSNEITIKLNDLIEDKKGFLKSYDDLSAEKREHVKNGTEVGKKYLELNKVVEGLVIENARTEEFNKSITKQINELGTSENIWGDMVKNYIQKILDKKNALKSLLTSVNKFTDDLRYHRFWEEGFSNKGLKSLIIESSIPQMNRDANLYSNALGGKYAITFSPQTQLKGGELREKFNVEVENKKGSAIYDGNSNGERRAIDSIVMFVLGDLAARRSNKRFNLIILDDVFEKLDMEICESINNVLRLMTVPKSKREGEYAALPERESIFVLTHLEYFQSKFENQIWVERINDGDTRYRETTD